MLRPKCRTWPSALFARFASTSISLRPYQEHCITSCLESLDAGASRLGVSLPTGSGKTTVFITLLSRLNPSNPNATRALVIVNSIELARQSASTAKHLFPDWTVEIEQGAKYSASGFADLTVATYQTLLNPVRFDKFDPTLYKAVIVDEAHHAAAPSYRKLLGRFHHAIRPKTLSPEEQTHSHAVPILGFSATFGRHDSLALGSVFEKIVYHKDFLQMIEEEWLCGVRMTAVKIELGLDKLERSNANGDYKPKSLSAVMNTPMMNEVLIKVWLDRAAKTRKSTLVFCVDLAHVRDLTNAFRRFGVDARSIDSHTPPSERKDLVAAFRAGEFPILINCAVLTEGADIPNIDCVLLARPTRSRNIFMQMIGRGMRLSPSTGKQDCLLIDFVDSTSRVSSAVSLPTLMGLDAWEFDQDEVTLEDMKDRARERTLELSQEEPLENQNTGTLKELTFTDHDSIADCFASVTKEDYHAMSPLAWVQCKKDLYILELMGRGHFKVQKKDVKGHEPAFTGEYINKSRPKGQEVFKAVNLEHALTCADQYIQEKILDRSQYLLCMRNAPWRRSPATSNQVAILQRRLDKSDEPGTSNAIAALIKTCIPVHRREKTIDEAFIKRLTKGEACVILCKLFNGGLRAHQDEFKRQNILQKLAAKKAKLDTITNPKLIMDWSTASSAATVTKKVARRANAS